MVACVGLKEIAKHYYQPAFIQFKLAIYMYQSWQRDTDNHISQGQNVQDVV